MFELHNLKPLVKKRKRVGRGGSRGGTSCKGHKGQKARSGSTVDVGFEGGQMPLHRRLPKRGFTNARFKKEFVIVNLDRINETFNEGDTVSKETLVQKGLIKAHRSAKGKGVLLKILGDGTLDKKIVVHADAFSKSALKTIADLGGEAHLT